MIEQVNPEQDPNWDTRLRDWPHATFFHRSAWHRVLRESYGFIPATLIVRQGAEIRGILPMMDVRSPLTGNRGVSLPFTDECEPLHRDHGSFPALFDAAVARGVGHNWKYIELRGGADSLSQAKPSVSFFGHQLNLCEDTAKLFAQFDSSTRRAIRKAEASGLTVEFSQSIDAVRDFYRLLSRTRQRHGVPPQPMRFFESIQRNVLSPGHGWIVIAKQGSTSIAGAMFLHSGNHVIYKYGASDDAFQHLRGNNLVMWEAIKRYAREGFRTLNFGRTSLRNEGLRRFKLGWGSTETQIDYFKYDLCSRQFVLSRDDASGWHTRVFNVLPRSVSRMIGTLLYKHIA